MKIKWTFVVFIFLIHIFCFYINGAEGAREANKFAPKSVSFQIEKVAKVDTKATHAIPNRKDFHEQSKKPKTPSPKRTSSAEEIDKSVKLSRSAISSHQDIDDVMLNYQIDFDVEEKYIIPPRERIFHSSTCPQDTSAKDPKKKLAHFELCIDDSALSTDLNKKHSIAPPKKHRSEKLRLEPLFDLQNKDEDQKDPKSLEILSNETALVSNYEYTSKDIARLILALLWDTKSTSKESFLLDKTTHDSEENYVIRCDATYILPPITHAGEFLLELMSLFFTLENLLEFAPNIILIPYNPGGHWVALYFRVLDSNEVLLSYIDSLSHESETSNVFHSQAVNEFLSQLTIKLKNNIKFFSDRKMEHAFITPKIQSDITSCGLITVENISDILNNQSFLSSYRLSISEIRNIKNNHRNLLQSYGYDFDFE